MLHSPLQPMRASQKRKMAKGPSLAEKRRMLMAAPVLQVTEGQSPICNHTPPLRSAWHAAACAHWCFPDNPLLHIH